jgi:hypothetical protein
MIKRSEWKATSTIIQLVWGLAVLGAARASAQPTQPKPKEKESEPQLKVSHNKSGYIDNAIVGTHLRLRYDSAFGMDRPDRAEFFYAKCGCFRAAGLDPDAPGPLPDAPSGDRVVETGVGYEDIRLNLEYALDRRFSGFVEIPFRFLEPEVNEKAAGLADLQLGVKFAAVASDRRYVTLQLRGYLPAGDAFRGLGTDHASLEPAVLYLEKLSDQVTLESELAYWHPTSGSSAAGVFVPPAGSSPDDPGLPKPSDRFFGDVVRYGLGVSYQFDSKWTPAPVVELIGWSVRGGFATISEGGVPQPPRIAENASGSSIVNLKAGLRIGPFYLGYGQALTRDIWYERIFRVEYRAVY